MGARTIALAAGLTSAIGAALLLGGALSRSGPPTPRTAQAAVPAESLQSGFAAGDTAATVASLQAAVRAAPEDVRSLGLLGLAYQQRARETGDPAYYTKSEGVLRRALRLAPDDLLATGGLGSLALSRHRFGKALELGRRATAISPTTARNAGIVGDALLELGRYREAFRAIDRMAALKPGLSSYARVGRARELIGDVPGAIAAMRLAVEAAAGPEATAWTQVQLGRLYWSTGRIGAAGAAYRAALRAFPGYVYALDALAQVEAAGGRHGRAIALARRAVARVPLPQFVATLGDLYHVTGRKRQAHRQYALIGAIERLLAANGVRTELETALFDADHGLRLRRAVGRARHARHERPSIDGDDALAWALQRSGRCGEALRYSRRALRLGTRDALRYFHRGMIERCLGHDAAARTWLRRALALNPHFSLLWAPVARRLQ